MCTLQTQISHCLVDLGGRGGLLPSWVMAHNAVTSAFGGCTGLGVHLAIVVHFYIENEERCSRSCKDLGANIQHSRSMLSLRQNRRMTMWRMATNPAKHAPRVNMPLHPTRVPSRLPTHKPGLGVIATVPVYRLVHLPIPRWQRRYGCGGVHKGVQ